MANLMLKFSIDDAKSNFFDRKATLSALDEQAHKGLSKFGAHVRRAARSSLKKARQKTLTEMSKDERQLYHIRVDIAKREGLPKPRRPLAHSKAGEPPRMILGLIKQFLFFSWDSQSRSVVIGPARIDNPTGAPETLEKGGYVEIRGDRVRIEPRPYMTPIFKKYYPDLPNYLAGLI